MRGSGLGGGSIGGVVWPCERVRVVGRGVLVGEYGPVRGSGLGGGGSIGGIVWPCERVRVVGRGVLVG